MAKVTRICRCGGIAIKISRKTHEKDPFGLEARKTTKDIVRCGLCHRTFRANIGRYEEWQLSRMVPSDLQAIIREMRDKKQ